MVCIAPHATSLNCTARKVGEHVACQENASSTESHSSDVGVGVVTYTQRVLPQMSEHIVIERDVLRGGNLDRRACLVPLVARVLENRTAPFAARQRIRWIFRQQSCEVRSTLLTGVAEVRGRAQPRRV